MKYIINYHVKYAITVSGAHWHTQLSPLSTIFIHKDSQLHYIVIETYHESKKPLWTPIKIKHPPLSILLVLCLSPLTWLHTVTPDFPRRSRKAGSRRCKKNGGCQLMKKVWLQDSGQNSGGLHVFSTRKQMSMTHLTPCWRRGTRGIGGASNTSPVKTIKTNCLSSWPPRLLCSNSSRRVFIDHRFISALHYTLWVTVKP